MQLTEGGSLYDRIGPDHLRALLTRFYERVAQDPDLAPIFPGTQDPARWPETLEKQVAFMTGLTGGPPLYHQRYGHPMLRARHLRFPITPVRARAWLACLRAALLETPEIERDTAAELYATLSRVAQHMVNSEDSEQPPALGG